MKIELLVSLKGERVWGKGKVFDDSKEPIPPSILREAKLNTETVRVITEIVESPEEKDEVMSILPEEIEEEAEKIEQIPDVTVPEKTEQVGAAEEWICEICGKGGFKSKRALKMHTMRAHKK